MNVLIWINDPIQATGIMQDLVFGKNHTIIRCLTEKDIQDASGVADSAIVDSVKKAAALKEIYFFSGAVKTINPAVPPPVKKIDRLLIRLLERIRAWLAEYGVGRLPLAMHALALRSRLWVRKLAGKHTIYMIVYGMRAGHLAYNTATCITALARSRPNADIIPVVKQSPQADPYLLELLLRQLGSRRKTRNKLIDLPLLRKSEHYLDSWHYTDVFEPIQKYGSEYAVDLMKYATDYERESAAIWAEVAGIDLADDYMIFHVRDQQYLNTHCPGRDWSYHNFRDADVTAYLMMACAMLERGLQSVRIGIATDQVIPSEYIDRGVVDYAQKKRNPIADLHLIANAEFLLGSNSGVTQVAQILHVPVAAANWAQSELLTTFREGDIFIPKKIYHKGIERLLTLSEILSNGVGRYTQKEQFDHSDLSLIDNTAEEISALAEEMRLRLAGEFVPTKEDLRRQEQFRSLINQRGLLCSGSVVACGAQFLADNEWFLG